MGGLGLAKAADQNFAKDSPRGANFFDFFLGPLPERPCAVAPDQGRNAYEDACCTGEAEAVDVDGL